MFPGVVEQEAEGLSSTLSPPLLATEAWENFLSFLQNGENPTHCVKQPWGLQESRERGLPAEAGHVGRACPTFVRPSLRSRTTCWPGVLGAWGQTSAIGPWETLGLGLPESSWPPSLPLSLPLSVSRGVPSTSPHPPVLQGPGQVSGKPLSPSLRTSALQAEHRLSPAWWPCRPPRLAPAKCSAGGQAPAAHSLAGQGELGGTAGPPVRGEKLTW